jgi:hypothetical protein
MIEGLEKRIVINGCFVSSLYLAYLLKIKNPEIYVTVINNNTNTQKYFVSNLDSLRKTSLFSLFDYKSIIKNKYTKININSKTQKISSYLENTYLFDYKALEKYLISSCLSQNIKILENTSISKIENNCVFINNSDKKELSYYYLILEDVIDKLLPKQKEHLKYLNLVVDINNNQKQIDINIVDTNKKTIVFEQPINEYTKKVIVISKEKDLESIFLDYYKDKEYKIITKEEINKPIASLKEENIFYIGASSGLYNHLNVDDVFLSLLNVDVLSRLITQKIKLKKDIKKYGNKIIHIQKEVKTSRKIKDFILSKTNYDLDLFLTKINNLKILSKINVSSFTKDAKKIKLNPKILLLLKELL